MRIGILSLNPGHNYGGILQSFAIQTVLESMGHEVSVICKSVYEKEPNLLHSYKYLSRIFRMMRYHSTWEGTVIPERTKNRISRKNLKNTECFMKKYLHRKIVDNFSELKEKDFDCIIVGSDQVWRKIYFEWQYGQPLDNAYLSFTEGWNIKRVSYAASFGTDEWEYTDGETNRCGELLRKFDAVTVREDSGATLCKERLGVEAKQMIDPTLLLTADDYIKRIDLKNTPKSNGNILVYVLDKNDEIGKLIERVAKEKELKLFEIAKQPDKPYPSVEEWIRGFIDAELVITDSFHACVFSLIFNKPFIVTGNRERGMARFESFLKEFNLEDRLLYNIEGCNIPEKIDYSHAENRLKELRKEAYSMLQSI